ncbi:MAG: DegT/DnrJ/EryC1/StrS family aminotransferase [Chloroflexi bacterium]|nr:DegT/DnrJ/EryC1/StrS family aminotransferase [Chloroflexota bacterium]
MKIPPAKIHFPAEDREQVLQRIDEALATGQLTLGKHGREFEEHFARYIGTKHAVAVNSGTSSLEIPLRILGVQGKTVLVPTNTFFATPASVLHAGGEVRFVDADPATFSLDVESLRRSVGPDTVGVMVVHIGGIVTPRMAEIQQICQENGLWLFEDAAHAHGSDYNGQRAGTFGVAASFSFYPTKVMTSGEGGMIVTDDERIADEARLYRDQGKISFTQNLHDKLGYNWRMSEPHAIIGLSQFARLEEFIAARQRIAAIYDEGLRGISGISPLPTPAGCRNNYYKYIALLDKGIDRDKLKKVLREEHGVSLSGEVYELPCHLQPIFKGGHAEGGFPLAEDICRRQVCLPVYVTMTDDEARYVISSLRSALVQG